MRNKKGYFLMLIKFIAITIVISYFASYVMGTTYSSVTSASPDLIITYNNDGTRTQEGSIFGDELWFPGKEKTGIVRIQNKFKTFDLGTVGIEIDMDEGSIAYNSLLNNMILSLSLGKLAIFDKIIIEKTSFYDLQVKNGTEGKKGILLDGSKIITVARGDFIDIKYTLVMAEDAGNELQNLSVAVSLLMRADEVIVPREDEFDDNPTRPPANDVNNEGAGDVLIDIPPDLIPLGGNHWAHDCIIALLEAGIIQGYSDGTIKPDQSITRAEVAILLAKALEIEPEHRFFSGYIDPLPAWAKGYIVALSDRGIYKGYPFRLFKPNNNISREEMVAVLIRGFEKSMAENLQLDFIDKEDIGEWAEEYVITGVATKILEGYPDRSFKPKQEITRAEAFTIICKLLGLHDEHSSN